MLGFGMINILGSLFKFVYIYGLFTVGASKHHTKVIEKMKKKCVSLKCGHCCVEFVYGGGMSVQSTTANVLGTSKGVLLKINVEQLCVRAPLPITGHRNVTMTQYSI
jgi:hypothetical protein